MAMAAPSSGGGAAMELGAGGGAAAAVPLSAPAAAPTDVALSDNEWTDDVAFASKVARTRGYEGDPCTGCGQFTLVRAGTCTRCVSCGSTSGCS